ncbi:MAG: hypothetical protein U0271_04830 [Polyangiaceae bacterium]
MSSSRLDSQSLSDACGHLAELAGEVLVPAPAREAMASLPRAFDGRFSWLMLECRVSDDARVDLVLHVDREKRDGLAEACAAWPVMRDVAAAWTRPSSPLFELATFTAELDLGGSGWSTPIVFAALESSPGEPPMVDASRAVRALLRVSGHREDPPALARALDALGPRGWPMHVASLLPRGRDGVRLVASIPSDEVGAFAERAGWEGSPSAASDLATRLSATLPRLAVHLDLGANVGPDLGVEVFFPGSPKTDRRWAPIFRYLDEVHPAKAQALADWPQSTGDTPRLLGIKVVVRASGERVAKAYLAARRAPEV